VKRPTLSPKKRRGAVLRVMCLALMLVVAGVTSLNVALPSIAADTGASQTQQQWIVDAYALVFAALLLPAGAIGDRFGRKTILALGLALYGGVATFALFADGTNQLITVRALLGLAAAAIMPVTLSVITSIFPPEERGKAVGTWTAWTGIATVIGPAGGGALIEAWSWRGIFLVNVPLILLTMWIAHRNVEESVDAEADRQIDWVGIALSAAGLGGPVFALIQQPEHGWGDPMVFVPLIAGIVIFALFLAWESRYRHAMLDMRLFKVRNFTVTNIETLVVYAGLFGAFFFITLFLQQTAG